MNATEKMICNAWFEGAKEFGFELITPSIYMAPDGTKCEYFGYLPFFDCDNGTLISTYSTWERTIKDHDLRGDHFISLILDRNYTDRPYGLEDVKKHIQDSKWYGEESKKPRYLSLPSAEDREKFG